MLLLTEILPEAVEVGAGVVALIIGMFAVLILGGLFIMAVFWGGLFRRIPVVGPPLASAFDAAANGLRSATVATWHGTLWAVDKCVHAAVVAWRAMLASFHNLGVMIMQAVEHQAYIVLPREISGAKRWATRAASGALVTALEYGRWVYQQAKIMHKESLAYTDAQVLTLRRHITGKLTAAVAKLTADIGQVRQLARQLFSQAEATARQLFTRAEADARAGDAQTLAQAVATSLQRVDGEAAAAAATVWAGLDQQVTQLEQVLGTDMPDVARMLQQIPAATPASLAALAAGGLAFLPPLLQMATDCTVPTCQDLGGLSDLLHVLESAAGAAALLAWLIYCIGSPGPAARDTVDVLDPLAGVVMTPLLALLQVA